MKKIMRKPIVFMFSGQGSHYYQMGQELFEKHPVFKLWMQEADNIYQEITGLSIIKTLYDEGHTKSDSFMRTLLTHPAIFMVEHALGQVIIAEGIQPDYVLGTSLGEFAAAVFADILSFETALTAVVKQAQLLEKHCPSGSMLAILSTPNLYYDNSFLHNKSELAAINCPLHFVVSSEANHLSALEIYLVQNSISFQRLAVNHGFHSSLIDAAAVDYQHFINQQSLRSPMLPFISCAKPSPSTTISRQHFWNSIRLPIQFQAILENLEKESSYYYIDLGPSGTLATFVKYNLSNASASEFFPILTPFGGDLNKLTKAMVLLC